MRIEAKIHALSALGCAQPWEALLCLPKIHVDKRGAYSSVCNAPLERPVLLRGVVLGAEGFDRDDHPTRALYPAYTRVMFRFDDGPTSTRLYRADQYEWADRLGDAVTIRAVVGVLPNGRRMLKSAAPDAVSGLVEPTYTGLQGQVSGEKVEAAIRDALQADGMPDLAAQHIGQNIPANRVLNEAGRSARWLLHALHEPRNLREADEALRLARHCCVEEVKYNAQATRESRPSTYNIDEALVAMVKAQPETLSDSQKSALNVIRKTVNSKCPASILLNGDVGSGKTLVFLLACAAIAKSSGRSVGVMVPSELVARQIHTEAEVRFPDLAPALVCAGAAAAMDGRDAQVPRLFVGTQSLLSMPGLDLAALVVDEQHKFSVDQRARIAGQHTHIIESSATPIPRTLALALFDGWDYALIRHGPTSKTITNHVIPEKARQQARELVQKHLRASRKVIFLYPSVNGKAGSSVMSRGKALQEWFAGKVGIIHGKLKPQEKIDAIARFRDGTTPILVASTAVEVGVDVPDVGLMVVSGADRFGVSQLHQLRGRLVRNGGEGDFVMMTPASVSKATLERLNAVAQNNNGFDLAQRDLELRGFGNVLGDMQTGDSTTLFKLARLEPADFFAG